MPTNLNGFYAVEYEGLNPGGVPGKGVAYVTEGKIYGGDSGVMFVGHVRQQEDGTIVASVSVFPRDHQLRSITGIENRPWDIPDIRGIVHRESPILELHLDGERYDRHEAISLKLFRTLTL